MIKMNTTFKLKYGQEGLFMTLYNSHGELGVILISKNYKKIFEFLGLSFERWEEGFDKLEDIFDYIIESPFFNWKMFQFDQLNKINRDRNKKRASYVSFIEYVDKHAADEKHEYNFIKDGKSYFDKINDFFPEANLILHVRKLEYLETRKLYIQAKFSGGEVMRKYGLQGKGLGDALTGFKTYVYESCYEFFDEFIIQNDIETIYKVFEEYLEFNNQIASE